MFKQGVVNKLLQTAKGQREQFDTQLASGYGKEDPSFEGSALDIDQASQGGTFAGRAAIYRQMQTQLSAAGIDTVWFGVGADLNDFFAINAGKLLTAESFMNDLGVALLDLNTEMFNKLMSGKISLTGQALDNFLVTQEQLGVQDFLMKRFGGSIPTSIQIPVNIAFLPGSRGLMPTNMINSINFVEIHNGQSFNFWDTGHRIDLGQAMMSQARHGR